MSLYIDLLRRKVSLITLWSNIFLGDLKEIQ